MKTGAHSAEVSDSGNVLVHSTSLLRLYISDHLAANHAKLGAYHLR